MMVGPTVVGSIRRFRRVVLVALALGLFVGLVWWGISPPEYAGKAGIIVTPLPASLTVGLGTAHVSVATFNAQQTAILESPAVAERAANKVNAKFPDAHLSGQQVENATSVKLPTPGTAAAGSTITHVTVTLTSPVYAPAAANAVVASYLEQLAIEARTQAQQSLTAINRQIAATEAALKSIPAPTPQKSTTTTTTVPASVIHPPVSTTTRPPHTTTTRPPMTTTTRPPRTTTTRQNPTTTTTAPQTTTTAAAQAGIRQPAIQLTAFETDATTTTTTAASSSTTVTTSTSPSSTSSSGSSSNSTNAANRAALLSTLANLNRAHAQIKVNQEVDLVYLANLPNTSNVQPATTPGAAANGSLLRTLAIFGGSAFLIGAIAAFILANSRRRFEKAEDPAALYGAPLITTIPVFETSVWSQLTLPLLTNPFDEAAEAFRTLATVLRARRGDSDTLVVAFSGADLRAGTTTTIANTGLALAEMGERVLVIDADPLGRGLTNLLTERPDGPDLGAAPMGLSELLVGRSLNDTVLPAIGHTGLMLVPCGQDPEMAVRRWRSGTLRRALEDLSERFDVILIDTPPMGTSSFSVDFVSIAEHLVMVVPHLDSVELHEVVARRLPLVSIELMGYVYNGTPADIRFAPYFPILRDSSSVGTLYEGSQPLPSPVSSTAVSSSGGANGVYGAGSVATVRPVSTSVSVDSRPTPYASQSAADRAEPGSGDITGQTPAVRPRDDDTAVVPIVKKNDPSED
jgi:Mrp family chromosome partitioning ATPase